MGPVRAKTCSLICNKFYVLDADGFNIILVYCPETPTPLFIIYYLILINILMFFHCTYFSHLISLHSQFNPNSHAPSTLWPIGSQLPLAVHYPHHLYLSNAPLSSHMATLLRLVGP